jgi:hypothetical protein
VATHTLRGAQGDLSLSARARTASLASLAALSYTCVGSVGVAQSTSNGAAQLQTAESYATECNGRNFCLRRMQ